MLNVKGLSVSYGKQQILHDISFTAKDGSITTILGCNGCGKSTLLKSIVGALPYEGSIFIDETDCKSLSSQQLAQKMAYLAQGKNIPDISVSRMVLHGRFPYLSYPRRYSKADIAIAHEAMKQMGIENLAEKPIAELSGGMRQKVYLAMALAQQADIIVMDEPTTYLDIGQQLKFADLVKELAAQGKTALLVLHDILMALRISDHIIVMDEGKIAVQGSADEVLKSGILQKLYGIRIASVNSEKGRQYYYEMD